MRAWGGGGGVDLAIVPVADRFPGPLLAGYLGRKAEQFQLLRTRCFVCDKLL